MPESNFCAHCGTPHQPGAAFCTECGTPFAPIDASPVAPEPTPMPPTASVPPPPPPVAAAPPPPAAPAAPVAPVPGPTPRPDDGRGRVVRWLGIGVALLVVVAVAVGAFALLGGDDEDEAEVFLEPVAYTGADPWTDSTDAHNATSETTEPVLATTAPTRPISRTGTRSVVGAWPGLYGGTRNVATCDKEQLVAFLKANPAKARAWAEVEGIAVADIETYVAGLTPVLLQRDTRVTNHGYRDGRATSMQSVLQAGTAVLVDEFGVPRVKCNCGNPLGEPTALSSTPTYTGSRWPTFSPANVVRVTVDVKVEVFVLVDVKGGEPITRPTGTDGDEDGEITVDDLCALYPDDPGCRGSGDENADPDEPELGTGDVQVTLRWGSSADLDLAVTDPTGATVDFNQRTSPSGGSLDVDSNAACDGATGSGVENVFWPTGSAPDGTYTMTVTYFAACGSATGPQSFDLTFKVAGSAVAIEPASLRRDGDRTIATYEVEVGRPSLLGPAGVTTQNVSGTLAEGESKAYKGEKSPEPPPTTTTEGTRPDDETTAEPPDCSMYEEGSMMRILCEHQPGEAVDDSSLPVPVPGD